VLDAPARQALLGEEEALARSADEVGDRHPAVPEEDLGMAAEVLVARCRGGPALACVGSTFLISNA
jgi:hypothetical protein